MKHTLKVTLMIIMLFLTAQLVGLVTINKHIEVFKDTSTGEVVIEHPDTVLGPPAEVENKSVSFLWISLLIIIGTGILLLIIKYKVFRVWKVWFLLAVWSTMAVAFGVYMNWTIAAVLALGLALWKIYRPNVYIYNFTEMFIYTGIAILMLSLLNLFAAFALLILVSFYDMYAVWKSKHMITMAKFQTESKVFAGLLIPYKMPTKSDEGHHKMAYAKQAKAGEKVVVKSRQAILGGGDIAFPLIFSSVVMEHLITVYSLTKEHALALAGIISLFSAAALFILLAEAENDKFYPAMPFISAGCFIGYLVILLII